MEKTAVEFIFDAVYRDIPFSELLGILAQAKEMEKQQQQCYSEEEVIKLLQQYRYDLSSGKTSNIGDTTGLWFEEFKNK
jgi:hypothetical protein